MKTKSSIFARNWPKYLLQWLSLAAILVFLTGLVGLAFPDTEKPDPEALCPMGGLQAFGTYLVRGSLPCSMNTLQIVMGLALAAAVVFLGKLFCGYLCPVGTVEDLLGRLRRVLHIRPFNISRSSVVDKILRVVKYGLLFWIFYMTCSSSELFCKKFDPYYAVATGFKGEIVLWGSICALVAVALFGLFIDRFWCKYICPLGAVSNSFKFYLPLGGIILLWWVLSLLGVQLHWAWPLGALCLTGYLFEILNQKPAGQVLTLVRDEMACTHCGLCEKECPYAIDILHYGARMNDVDCTLCGDCIGACPHKALGVGAPKTSVPLPWTKMVPACLAVVLTVVAFCVGNSYELPTIDEEWEMEQVSGKMEKVQVEGLRTVKCFGSSMAFKARMQKVPGVHRVKTYVKSHTVEVFYDPAVTNADKIQTAIFVPSRFRINSPDPKAVPQLKVQTIRVEKMYDKLDLNYLGLQMRQTGKRVYGLESEFDCPVKVLVYSDPAEPLDEAWFKDMVNRKSLDMPLHGGGTKKTPMNLEFVRMEEGVDSIATTAFLEKMFDGFFASYNGRYAASSLPKKLRESKPDADSIVVKRSEVYAGKKQFIYELADTNYQKPIVRRALPFLSNHISREEGIISLALTLNRDYAPALQIRYAAPATPQRIWELLQAKEWTITYKVGDVRQEKPRMSFRKEGEVIPVEN